MELSGEACPGSERLHRGLREIHKLRTGRARSSHRTRTQGDCGGMLTACLVNPDDLDAVTRLVISNEGCDVFGSRDGVAAQCSDLISGFETRLCGGGATNDAIDCCARSIF